MSSFPAIQLARDCTAASDKISMICSTSSFVQEAVIPMAPERDNARKRYFILLLIANGFFIIIYLNLFVNHEIVYSNYYTYGIFNCFVLFFGL